ncbi:MAG: GNAT family N-acetyltransferase, partial [Leptospiraceae bacterium]|nr:GNAT family N-acetyltransferase [Leptospiraceae bacterium]
NGCDSRPVVFLEGIWVGDQYRQKGVGRLLVTEISNWSRVNGFTEIGSDVEIDNTISNISHIKWGFEEMERVVYYRKKI